MNVTKKFRLAVAMAICSLQMFAQQPDQILQLPEFAGVMRFGVSIDTMSFWLSEADKIEVSTNGDFVQYTISDKRLGRGKLTIETRKLIDTEGISICVKSTKLPENWQLMWAYGACSGEEHATIHNDANNLMSERCADNVFSIEGDAVTVYYGNSRRLKILTVIAPDKSNILLSDANQQQSPLAMYRSGKKTNSPAVCAMCPATTEPQYFAIYKQNPKADYNKFMLAELHLKGSFIVHSDTQWMESTPN